MPRKNQIPYFASVRRPNGEIDYYWKPTRKLRELGYANLKLPDGYKAAIAAAIEQNERVAAAAGRAAAITLAPPPPATGRTFREALRDYEGSGEFASMRPSSQANYRSYLRELDRWTTLEGGPSMPLADLDRQMILDLRDTLNRDSRHYRRVHLFAVLGVVLQYFEDRGWIANHPGRNLRVRGAPPRKHRLLREHLQLLLDAAIDLAMPHVAVSVTLAFYTMQRQKDLLLSTGFKVQRIHDISTEARRALAGGDGKVMALFLEQEKTDVPVGIPLVPEARAAIEASLAAARPGAIVGTHLVPNPAGAGACPSWRIQRDFRAVLDRAVEMASASQQHELAEFLKPKQFRDLRRSGMCWMRDLGVPVPLIAAISGHSIEETQKILDTYMPRDTRAAAEGMAMAVTRQAERDAADKEELG